jgi:phage shock protein PspC (stress-responsive transcriptional regulator)
MDANDRNERGPEDPTAEQPPGDGPQAPAGEPAAAGGPEAAGTGGGGPARKRLVRVREGRVLGGVCAGLGRYFNADPILFRIGAVALAFIGGAGLLLYLAALLLMPSEEGGAAMTSGTQGRNRALVIAAVVALVLFAWPFLLGGGFLLAGIGIPLALLVGTGVLVWWIVSGEGPSGDIGDIARRAALGIGVLILSGIIAFGGAFGAALAPDWVGAAIVIAAGAAIVAGAFLKPVRWLVLPAVTLALAVGTVAAADIDIDGGMGHETYRPASTADLRDRYELGVGELVVDLTSADLPPGDVPVGLDVGVGEARLIVPDDVCVATDADVGMGNVHVFGRDNSGVDVNFDEEPGADRDATRLVVDAEVGLGEFRVHDEQDELEFRDDFHGFDYDEDPGLGGAGNSACTTGETARE